MTTATTELRFRHFISFHYRKLFSYPWTHSIIFQKVLLLPPLVVGSILKLTSFTCFGNSLTWETIRIKHLNLISTAYWESWSKVRPKTVRKYSRNSGYLIKSTNEPPARWHTGYHSLSLTWLGKKKNHCNSCSQ